MRVDKKALYLCLGIKLRKARKKLGATQKDVADAVGFRQNSICTIEAGKERVPLDRLYDICIYLKLDPRKFLPEIAEVTTRPTKRTVPIGGNLVPLTNTEAVESIIKLDKLLGKKRKQEL